MAESRRSSLIDALSGKNSGRPPAWIMRQAGRYLAEYRAVREKHSFKEMCDDPGLALEVSLLPHRLFDMDAIIVFNDILIPLEAMGAPLEYTDTGPVFTRPIRDSAALATLGNLDPKRDSAALLDTIGLLRAELGDSKAVLGFAGAPFTLASYLVAGAVGQGLEALRLVLRDDPDFLHRLLEKLADMTIDYLGAQIEAGADAVQLFDTWAGQLDPPSYREFALPYHKRIFSALKDRFAAGTILYVKQGGHVLEEMAASGARALSIDSDITLSEARKRVGPRLTLQGNLSPESLFDSPDVVRERVRAILEDRRGDPAYIFNLGHGILPQTPVDSVHALVETVHNFSPSG